MDWMQLSINDLINLILEQKNAYWLYPNGILSAASS